MPLRAYREHIVVSPEFHASSSAPPDMVQGIRTGFGSHDLHRALQPDEAH